MRKHHRQTSCHHTMHNLCTCTCMQTRSFDNHNKKTRMETIQENAPQRKLAHRSMTMIITLAKITVTQSCINNFPSSSMSYRHQCHHRHRIHHCNHQQQQQQQNYARKSIFILIAIAINSIEAIILSSSQSQPSPPYLSRNIGDFAPTQTSTREKECSLSMSNKTDYNQNPVQ